MRVGEVMSQPVVSVTAATPLRDVARLLVERGISGLPVVDADGGVVGVVSEADFLVKERGRAGVRRSPLDALFGEPDETREQLAKVDARTAGDAMTRPAVTIEPDRPIQEAAATMIAEKVNRLPVVESGRLVGIVTRADLVRAYVRSDDDIAGAIREEVLRGALWTDPARFDVSVTDGIARIEGRVERRSDAATIERMVPLIPGVFGTELRVTWDLDDRDIRAPGADHISRFTPPRDR